MTKQLSEISDSILESVTREEVERMAFGIAWNVLRSCDGKTGSEDFKLSQAARLACLESMATQELTKEQVDRLLLEYAWKTMNACAGSFGPEQLMMVDRCYDLIQKVAYLLESDEASHAKA